MVSSCFQYYYYSSAHVQYNMYYNVHYMLKISFLSLVQLLGLVFLEVQDQDQVFGCGGEGGLGFWGVGVGGGFRFLGGVGGGWVKWFRLSVLVHMCSTNKKNFFFFEIFFPYIKSSDFSKKNCKKKKKICMFFRFFQAFLVSFRVFTIKVVFI